jgi:(1->4)-alpha-D-glucan 1-alpha-D-glucosylmutase
MAAAEVAVPRATYRLQLRPEFGFDDAGAIADYLAELGVSHVYTSPYLQAAPGSTHGYDVVDHSRVNDDLGGPPAHRRFVDALGSVGLAQVIDVVPNHMAIGPRANRWWWDVLENGRSSRFAGHFDIDWDPAGSRVRNRLLMPILGDHYGRVLERGELQLRWDPADRFTISYFDHVVPVAPRSLHGLLGDAAARCADDTADHLAFIGHSLARLPSVTADADADVETRHRDKEVLYQQLQRLAADRPQASDALRVAVDAVNADVDALDALCDLQNYRLAHWRTAGDELDYRRFFDISTLVGLRVESAQVFADTHQLILRWLADGEVDGLRIDHPDGLHDPGAYFELLRAAAPEAWIVVEKILEPGEAIPTQWPVDGTTGYEHAHLVTRLLHDARGAEPIHALYRELTGDDEPWPDLVRQAKLAVLDGSLATDVSRLVGSFRAVADGHRRWRDFTRRELRDALVETAAAFPVYRSYVRPHEVAGADDRRVIAEAVAAAADHRPDLDPDLFAFLELVLTADLDADTGPGPASELRLRFQQLTGPAMAKGVEDTVFYDRVPLGSLNEVGADPTCFAIEPEQLHAALAHAAARFPASMLTLSTHDTKRSEDVRARLAVLSELPGAWSELARRWISLVEPHRPVGEGVEGWPDPRMEHLLLQTLVGAHPLPLERAVEYLAKATKEAKRNTSWTDPNPDFDAAVERFVTSVCADEALMDEVGSFAQTIVEPGRVSSLAQKLITLTAPGVPDVYQGTELWDLSLVDPDNRRPVDFDRRRRLLGELASMTPAEVAARGDEGLPKLLVVSRSLRLRRAHPDWFAGGEYRPLEATGGAARHLFAFVRGGHSITVVTRLPVGLDAAGGWGDTTLTLPPGPWHDALAGTEHPGGTVPVAELLGHLPVALLHDGDPRIVASGGGR